MKQPNLWSKFKQMSLGNKLYVILASFTVLLFSLLAIASVFLQKDLRESEYDTRSGAMVADGVVEVSLAQWDNVEFEINSRFEIPVMINTNNAQLSSLSLEFTIDQQPNQITQIEFSPETAIANLGLEISSANVEATADGDYVFTLEANSPDATNKFSTQEEVELGRIFLEAQSEGAISVQPDHTNSVAIVASSLSDELKILQDHTYLAVAQTPDENPVVWETDEARFEADNFKIKTDNGLVYRGEDFRVTSYPYDEASPTDNHTTLEVRWTEHDYDMKLIFYFKKDKDRWWLEKIDSLDGENPPSQAEAQIYYSPNMSDSLGEEYAISGQASFASHGTYTYLEFTNYRLQAFLNSPYCGNEMCEVSETPSNCSDDCGQISCQADSLQVEYLQCANSQGTSQLMWNIDQATNSQTMVQIAQQPDFSNPQEYQVNTNQLEISNLANGTWYARVKLTDAGNCDINDDWSTPISFQLNCADNQCAYILRNDWSECTDGWQAQSFDTIGTGCPAPAWDVWHQPCQEQCQYSCSDWSECGADLIQERDCIPTNDPCWDYAANQEGGSYAEQRSCDPTSTSNIIFSSYEACWYGPSEGNSTYIAWNSSAFPNVKAVDISPQRDFSQLANKNVEDADLEEGYGITDADGFYWEGTEDELWLDPEKVYYTRLYYRPSENQDYTHSPSTSFRMHRCSGDPNAGYSQCQESCLDNKDCAAGLTCQSNRCVSPVDPSDPDCFIPESKKGCADWCADSNECADGLSCWYNYCRNPENIDISVSDQTQISMSLEEARQTNCGNWDQSQKNKYIYYTQAGASNQNKGTLASSKQDLAGCNEICQSNRGCEPNYRCYQGQCRLAVAPEDSTCQGILKPENTPTPSATVSAQPTAQPTNTPEPKLDKPNQTVWDDISQFFKSLIMGKTDTNNLFSQDNAPLWLALAAISTLGLVGILFWFLLKSGKDDQKPPQPSGKNKQQSPDRSNTETQTTRGASVNTPEKTKGEDLAPPPSAMSSQQQPASPSTQPVAPTQPIQPSAPTVRPVSPKPPAQSRSQGETSQVVPPGPQTEN